MNQAAIDRCRREIEAHKAAIRAGEPEIAGLCLALADWAAELRLLLAEEAMQSNLKETIADLQSLLPRVGEDARVVIYCHNCDCLDDYKGATGEGPTRSVLTGEVINSAATVVVGVNSR